MKGIFSIAILSALTLSASAVQINKARQAPTPVPSYTVATDDNLGVRTGYASDANGNLDVTFDRTLGFLVHAEIDFASPANSVTCVVKDQFGDQVRAFGGAQFGDVNSIDLVPADGEQVFSMICFPATGF